MKKSIVLGLFVCLAMSMSAYAQSENSAVLSNPSGDDGVFFLITDVSVSSQWRGPAVIVETPSGQVNYNVTLKLVVGDGYDNKKPEVFEFIGFKSNTGVTVDLVCRVTPSQVITCNGRGAEL